MPRLLDPRFAPDCAISVDGTRVPARSGESVTSAMLAAGRPLVTRSSKYHRPRGPFCLAASCASCLVRVDGEPNMRACETPCRDGLVVESQNVVGGAAHDLLGAIDFFAPHGIDHHHVATWSQFANRLAVGASRRLAGLGRLPDAAPEPWPAASEERFDAVVVGAGPSGLAAAAALARGGRSVLLVERERSLGGRLRCRLELPGDPPLAWAVDVADGVRRSRGEVAESSVALGLWRDGSALVAAVAQRVGRPRLRLVRSPRWVLATGTWPQPPDFAANDLPGIHGARGLAVALAEDGVIPGERMAVLGAGREAMAVARRFEAAGMAVQRVEGGAARARGHGRLAGLVLPDGRSLSCDTLAVVGGRAPASELAREAGAELELVPDTGAFRVRPGPEGAVAPGVFAAGESTGSCSAAEAAEQGRRAGEAAARG